MSIGSFTLIKNEVAWIEDHIKAWLPFLDKMVFVDGNSTDGTLQVIEKYHFKEPQKVVLHYSGDPKNLQEDYVDKFNVALSYLKGPYEANTTDYAIFLHPDMFPGEGTEKLKDLSAQAATVKMISYAGNPGGDLFRAEGRGERWKNIYRLKPDLGAHYHGFYGASNEDVYFSKITGEAHDFYGQNFDKYPYEVQDSGLTIHHFSDVRSYERRREKMYRSLLNQDYNNIQAEILASCHPRVTLKDGMGIKFVKCEDPRRLINA